MRNFEDRFSKLFGESRGLIRVLSENYLVQHNKQYCVKLLLNSFHLNGHILGFHPP